MVGRVQVACFAPLEGEGDVEQVTEDVLCADIPANLFHRLCREARGDQGFCVGIWQDVNCFRRLL